MAKLKRAKSDGHYYVLAGRSKGTWQVSEQGVQDLEQYHVPIPREGQDSVDLHLLWWHYLREKGLVFKYGIPYKHRQEILDDSDAAHSESISAFGLPLTLCIQRDPQPTWSLALELTAIPDTMLAEAKQGHTTGLVLNDAVRTRVPLLQLQQATYLVSVAAQSAPYVLEQIDATDKIHAFEPPCFIPALTSSAEGNVFAQGRQKVWQRCLAGSNISFWGVLYWLARVEHQPQWPGNATKWGSAQDGWQLWRLGTQEDQNLTWQVVADWLNERHLRLIRHTQRLELVSPPVAVSPDGWVLVTCDQPLVAACYPPEHASPYLHPRLQLAVTQIHSDNTGAESSTHSVLDVSEWDSDIHNAVPCETLFARWQQPQPGDYRIHLLGDAIAEPLLIRVLPSTATTLGAPEWLQGFECSLKTLSQCVTLAAFTQSPQTFPREEDGGSVVGVIAFSARELAQVEWELRPDGVPVHVRWRAETSARKNDPWEEYFVTSSEELTRYWREDIWPQSPGPAPVSLLLNAGSFGTIVCTLEPANVAASEVDLSLTSAQCAELLWLAQCATRSLPHVSVPLPGDIQSGLDRFVRSTTLSPRNADVVAAITLLRAKRTTPAWIIPRLRRLIFSNQHLPRQHESPTINPKVLAVAASQ